MGGWCAAVLVAVWAAPAARAEIVDRIAVTVGDRVITLSEIRLQIRINAFLNETQPDYSAEERRRAAGRIVDQVLLEREIELSRFSEVAMVDVLEELGEIRATRFQRDDDYLRELDARQISEDDLKRYLQLQIRTLRFVDFRFRAGVQVTDQEIQRYYEQEFLPAWKKEKRGEPPLADEVRDDVEELLMGRHVDVNTEQWLAQARKQARIRYHEEAFQQ